MDYEKIIESLKNIKEVCKKSGVCEHCILQDPIAPLLCAVTGDKVPADWDIKEPEEIQSIKVFK